MTTSVPIKLGEKGTGGLGAEQSPAPINVDRHARKKLSFGLLSITSGLCVQEQEDLTPGTLSDHVLTEMSLIKAPRWCRRSGRTER